MGGGGRTASVGTSVEESQHEYLQRNHQTTAVMT